MSELDQQLAPSQAPAGHERGVDNPQANSIPAPPAPKSYGDGQEVEQRAREMGWTPEQEFQQTHPNGQWRTAEDFVARDGHVNQPKDVLVERSMRLDEMEGRLESLTQSTQKLAEISNKSYVRGLEEGMAKAQMAHQEAVENGDHAAALEAANEMARIDSDKRQVQDASRPDINGIQAQITSIDQNFTMANPWLKTNPMASAYFAQIVQQTAQIDPNTNLPDPVTHQRVLEAAKAQVLQQNPELAGVNPNRMNAPQMPGAERNPMGQQVQNGPRFESLDAMQQQMCMQFVNSGAYGDVSTPDKRALAIQAYVDDVAAQGGIGN